MSNSPTNKWTPPVNDDHLLPYKGIHDGERCFIVGTGKSINDIPQDLLSQLTNEITWGVNLVLECIGQVITPSYYACSEAPWLKEVDQVSSSYAHAMLARFYAHKEPVDGFPGWAWVPRSPGVLDMSDGDFAGLDDHFGWGANGRSVVMDVCVQMSVWMGFKEIYLLGCDGTAMGHCYEEKDPEDKRRYAFMHTPAEQAERILADRGIKLIDLTDGGTLTIQKSTLQAVLGRISYDHDHR